MPRITIKYINRIARVMRLLVTIQAYHHYTMMQMSRQLLQVDNSWQDAEHMSNLVNMMMPFLESSPTDFIHNKDEVSDEALDNYNGFKKWVKIAQITGISEKTLTAFCKNVDNSHSVIRLRILGHMYYPDYLKAFLLYLNKSISKTQLQNSFVEFTISGKTKPANFAMFRKVILDIEKTMEQIKKKQMSRSKNGKS